MRYWVGLGGNLGDPIATMRTAVDRLARHGVTVEATSGIYRTSPVGDVEQPDFVNAACRIATDDDPPTLLTLLKETERALGRRPTVRWGPRLIDLDILLWEGGTWSDDRLVVPHVALADRRFAVEPLLDLDGDLRLPDGRALCDIADGLRHDVDQRLVRMEGVTL